MLNINFMYIDDELLELAENNNYNIEMVIDCFDELSDEQLKKPTIEELIKRLNEKLQ